MRDHYGRSGQSFLEPSIYLLCMAYVYKGHIDYNLLIIMYNRDFI